MGQSHPGRLPYNLFIESIRIKIAGDFYLSPDTCMNLE